MDFSGHERAYPRPATAWWGVGLFTLGAILSYTDRQILAILVDPIRAGLNHDPRAVGYAMSCIIGPSVVIAIFLYAVAMLRAGHLRATSQSLS